jgi:gliding motility-associated-like protein
LQNSFAQHSHIEFKENKGQWENNILFKAQLPAGQLYLEQNKLTYQFFNEKDMVRMGDLHHGWIKNPQASDSILNLHAFEVEFINALTSQTNPQHPCSDYENYFIGNDSSKWATDVKKYQDVTYQNLYQGIDLKLYSGDNNGLKYDFIVAPNADATQIQLQYNGQNNISINKEGQLVITTSVNTLIEQKPFAYQLINGAQKEVKCTFKLVGNVLSFDFPKNYDKTLPLIIDPALIFASYSGSTIDNWGYTATYDDDGNLYGGGVAFGLGYPITTGAFQITYNGGYTDISITKFNPYGTNLIYSTYIGGASNDYPHSLIVNHNDELLILGTTQSINFPIANGYDVTYNGGYDIFITKLSVNGNVLLGSTYVGGSADDGLNWGNPLKYNYADEYRGEIVVDENDFVFVASTTRSTNFPTTVGVIGSSFIPGDLNQNACIFKLSPNLTTLEWSSYFGGNMDDAAYSLQFDELGNILFTGGTKSPDLPVSATAFKPTLGGIMDGYITKITADATTILACTYIGTSSLDQTFFVQLDTANNVYVLGQTEGNYPITPIGVYADSNSGQFLHKLTPNLDSTIFSTTFGSGTGNVDIAPSAFLVNDCNYILISGWGGNLNSMFGLAPFSSTNGLPVTANAQQSTTDGQDYYLAMFGENAESLIYASFFGGNNSRDHVDGGTSRFDKKGMVYQAVCASCGNLATNDFPTTPGAWSNTDNSTNCNMGVFKLDLTNLTAIADVYVTPYYCVGETVHFQNLSIGGISYLWDFGDGETSTDFEPYHVFDSAATYSVMLIVLDSTTCNILDSDFVTVYIRPLPEFNLDTVAGVCLGDTVQLLASGSDSYSWTSSPTISDTSIANPVVWPSTSTTYSVAVEAVCGADTLSIFVEVFQPNYSIQPDTIICRGQSAQINASGGGGYLWSPASSLNLDSIANPIATPDTTTIYSVIITDVNQCVWDTFMTVFVDTTLTSALASADVTICLGDTAEIYATEGRNYLWSPASSLTNPTDSFTLAFPTETTSYVVESSNTCNSVFDTVVVSIHQVVYDDNNAICLGDSAQLEVFEGDIFTWLTNYNISDTSISNPMVWPDSSMFYTVVVESFCGMDTVSVFVEVFQPNINIVTDTIICRGQSVQISASGGVSYSWTPSSSLNNSLISNPIATPFNITIYSVNITDVNQCVWDTFTTVFVDTLLPTAVASADVTICNGDTTALFVVGERDYLWSPASSLSNPTDSVTLAFPTETTSYLVETINSCGSVFDTVVVSIHQVVYDGNYSVCPSDSVQLEVFEGDIFTWLTNYNISNTSISNPMVWPDSSMFYTVAVESFCGMDTVSIFVEVFLPNIGIIADDTICRGQSSQLSASGGVSYNWTPTSSLNNSLISNPVATPFNTTIYSVDITDINSCVWDTFMTVVVDTNLPVALASSDVTICLGDTTSLFVTGGRTYQWTPSSSLSNPTDSITLAFPSATTTYTVGSINSCGTAYDNVVVTVLNVNALIVNDTSVCAGEKVNLWVLGGVSYWWKPTYLVNNPSSNIIQPTIYSPTLFTVNVVDANGCKTDLSVFVDTYPLPTINLEETISAGIATSVEIYPTTNGIQYLWSPADGLSCTTCLNPTAFGGIATTYTLTTWSVYGCVNSKSTTILFKGILYVPNAFTPNGDGDNDIFYAYGENIVEFEMMIFDRWGEKLFTSDNLDDGWDGTYQGELVKTETYVWKINYKDVQHNSEVLIGTVTLLR